MHVAAAVKEKETPSGYIFIYPGKTNLSMFL
jgi:hypothetical protein